MASTQISHDNAPSGLILLHKQPGITSFDALRDIKRMLGTGKVGHTGTLDKFAEGLLLALAGRALKLSRWFTHLDKQYEGVICFGAETDTLDPEGAVIAEAPLPSREAVEAALTRFCGAIEQAPPAYSAIHIDGKRASALARRGEIPQMQKRQVTIYRLELLSWQPPLAKIFVHCSSGTYIRSLARDIALAAGSRAHLVGLIRAKVGGFELEESVLLGTGDQGSGVRVIGGKSPPSLQSAYGGLPLPPSAGVPENKHSVKLCALDESGTARAQEIAPVCDKGGFALARPAGDTPATPPYFNPPIPDPRYPIPINKTIFEKLNIPSIDISPADAAKIRNGKPLGQILDNAPFMDETTAAFFSDDELIAIVEQRNNKWNYGYVYAHN